MSSCRARATGPHARRFELEQQIHVIADQAIRNRIRHAPLAAPDRCGCRYVQRVFAVFEEIGRDFVEQPNQFTGELLMPRELVLKEMPPARALECGATDAEDDAFDSVDWRRREEVDVSREAMTIRLSSLFACSLAGDAE
jgi:hypothetical protein